MAGKIRFNPIALFAVAALLFVYALVVAGSPLEAFTVTGTASIPFLFGMTMLRKDAALSATVELPDAASTTVDGAALDLGLTSRGDFLAECELKVSAPALTTTMLPDTKTMTYSVIHSDNSDLSSPSVLCSSVITQTGAGGAGAAATSATVRLPVDVKRYVGVRAVSGAGTTDSSAVSATAELLF